MGNNSNELDINEVHDRISKIISSMSEAEILKLLKGLEKWEKSKFVYKRKHYRKHSSLYAICEANRCYFRDNIKDVSAGGLFIETETPLSINEELFITFFHPDSKVPIKITGKIVRVDPKGVGVELYDTIPDI